MITGTVVALCGLTLNMLFVGSQLFLGERADEKRLAKGGHTAKIDGNAGVMI